ncbi:MAG: hypothetical protein JRN06_02245 [Nitrososphaerota archaeon]|nr:hypothetical protein [Nitrososphaerota archaeon]MDG7023324.1 hypothetical protein [Nitrososphaerota archaeon]
MSIGANPGSDGPEELTLSEITGRYKDRWVAILVSERDGNFQPTKGRVVAQDVDRYRLRSSLVKYDDVCIFYTGETPYPLLL